MTKGIGIDIIEIDRVKQSVKHFKEKFLKRIFTDREIAYCTNKKSFRFPELAARFAAKEAYSKALGTGINGIKWKNIEVINEISGKPVIYVSKIKKPNVKVSLSHSEKYATAVVLID